MRTKEKNYHRCKKCTKEHIITWEDLGINLLIRPVLGALVGALLTIFITTLFVMNRWVEAGPHPVFSQALIFFTVAFAISALLHPG